MYEDHVHRDVHLALTHGPIGESSVPLVRVHVADTLRDLLGIRCDSRAWTLRAAMQRVAHAGSGVIVILRDHESPRDLVDAARALNEASNPIVTTPPPIAPERSAGGGGVLRTYGVGAQILKDLGIRRMRVLSAPRQLQGISAFDLEIESYVGEDG
jgi:3,4-dihydroxy 2-butanone 4-phosphate synthase/GTP cyclohydrolase II